MPTTPAERHQAEQIIAAVDEAMTAYHDPTPAPPYGSTPPVTQPGRPPMSQRATDISAMMLSAGLATVPPGAITVGVLLASGYANPTVVAWICAAPAAVAVPILAVARVLRRLRDAAPDVHHHHYEGTVHQQHTHSHTRGVWAKNINQQ